MDFLVDLLATQQHPPTPVLNHQPELFHPHLETTWYHLETTWTTLGHHNLETFGIPELGQLRDTFWDNFEPLFGTSLRHLLRQLWDGFDKCFGQFWDKIGTTLRQLSDNFGTTFRQLWNNLLTALGKLLSFPKAVKRNNFGMILGQLWDHIRTTFRQLLDNLGTTLKQL